MQDLNNRSTDSDWLFYYQVPKSSNILTFKYTLETHRIFRHEQTGVKTKMTLYLNGFFLGGRGYLKILTSSKGVPEKF